MSDEEIRRRALEEALEAWDSHYFAGVKDICGKCGKEKMHKVHLRKGECTADRFEELRDEVRALAAAPAKKCVICGGELAKCEAAGYCIGPAGPAPALTGDKLKEIAMRYIRASRFDWDAIVQDPEFPR